MYSALIYRKEGDNWFKEKNGFRERCISSVIYRKKSGFDKRGTAL